MAVSVEPLGADLSRRRPIVWNKIDVTVRYNQVGAFTLEVPATPQNWDLIQFSGGNYVPNAFLIDWNGVFQFPCFAESYNPVRGVDDSGRIAETITFAGADFFVLLANRLVYRDSAHAWSAQTVGTTTVTDKAETVIKSLVAANMVTAGDTNRRVAHFTVAADLAHGATVTYKIIIKSPSDTSNTVTTTADQTLMDMVRAVAAQSNIGAKIGLVGGNLVFDCFIPRDLSQSVVFSERLGNLRGWNLSDAVPTANVVLMQTGATSGSFVETDGTGATDPWRRVEQFSDQSSTTDATQISQAQTDALNQGAAAAKIGVTVVDIPRLRFGTDDTTNHITGYGVGDTVATDVRDGVTYTDIVSAVHLTADATTNPYTETVTPTIGAAEQDSGDNAGATAKLSAKVRALEKKLRR